MLRELFIFASAIWAEWTVLLTGGSIAAIVWITNLSGHRIPLYVNWLVFGVTFGLSSFFAWRKQWVAAGSGETSITLVKLLELREGKTTPRAKLALKPHIGKRITISGSLTDISTVVPLVASLIFLSSDGVSVGAYISYWKAQSLAVLPKESVVTLSGRISRVNGVSVVLNSCEILETSD